MKTVLVVDDDAAVAETLAGAIRDALPAVQCGTETDFDVAMRRIADERPDVVVLDLRKDAVPEDVPGKRAWGEIWEKRFCPIVIYTAWGGDLDPPVPPNHPYAKYVTKGSGSERTVVEHLRSFGQAVEAIAALRGEVDAVIHRVLRDTAGAGVFSDRDGERLQHAGRRRIAASMDDPTLTSGATLKSWEQYLIPAMGDSPLTGDVLRRCLADQQDVGAYRLVLTPSCDLVRERNPGSILVAKCEDVRALLAATGSSTNARKRDDAVENLRVRALSRGFLGERLPLPEFPGHVPLLVANMKELEVLDFRSVCPDPGSKAEFLRVASVDSPFRELVSWAFLSTIARPGLPNRDLDEWAGACIDLAAHPLVGSGDAGEAAAGLGTAPER